MREIFIGNKKLQIPIVQGGMGVGISRWRLAGTVAREGGLGVISTAQIGYDEPEFKDAPIETNLKAIGKHIRKAREIAAGGIIGVNIMVATKRYAEYVRESVKAGADIIISGAGIPAALPKLVEGSKTKIAPIVSMKKAAEVILKLWDRKYHRTADMVIIEGPNAGGHLGFSEEQLQDISKLDYENEIREIIKVIGQYEQKYNTMIPVIVAGGIYTEEDAKKAFSLGADGIQVATRFVTTEECDASDAYKEAYIKAKKEDIMIVKSPVGMPGRAIKNKFLDKMKEGREQPESCFHCLEHCNPAETPYCITKALCNAVRGDLDNGLIFCGAKAYLAERISTVREVIKDLIGNIYLDKR